MIKTLYETGRLLKQGFDDEFSDYFNPWQNPYPRAKDNCIVIVINIENGKLSEKIEMENFSKKRVNKYLYREAKANTTNLVPTFIFIPFNDSDKQKKEISKRFKKIQASINNYGHNFIKKDDLKRIPEMLESLILDIRNQYLLTFKIDNKYFGDYEEYVELFYKEAYHKYYKDSSEKNKTCAVTYENVPVVWGRVNTLGFTVDDATFSRSGFETKKSFKMFPVSPDAVKVLEGIRKFTDEKLSRNFYGLKYFTIPHFILLAEEQQQFILEEFIDKVQNPNSSFKTEVNSIFESETIIKEIIESETLSQNSVYYDIFFYQINNAQFLIKLHLSDVLPSQFRKIMNTKQKVESFFHAITTIHTTKEKTKTEWVYHLTLANIKDFFSNKTQRGITYHPYFFKIVESIFYGTQLNEQTIITTFYNEVKKAFKQKEYFESTVKRTFAIYQFFYELNLFKNYQDMEIPKQVPLDLDEFVKTHEVFFAHDTKKAAFFLGCLTEKLLQKQRSKLNSEPFVKNLNGLNIDHTQMKKIHLKLMDKIPQYGSMYSKDEHKYNERLNKEIAPRLMEISNLSKVDISYAFAIGMVMQKEFTNQYFENKKIKE